LAFGNPINNAILRRGEWRSKLALVHCRKWKMLGPELKFKKNNQPVGCMLPPPALASRCHPAHPNARGVATPPLQPLGKAKRQQSTSATKTITINRRQQKQQHW